MIKVKTFISDYDGGEVYIYNIFNEKIENLSKILSLKLQKPHTTKKYSNQYFTIDTQKKVFVYNDKFQIHNNFKTVYFFWRL